MTRAGLYLRILVAWLLAMQPMVAAYGGAQAADAPFAMELCRGAPAPSADGPAEQHRDHAGCCLSCTPFASAPARGADIATPAPILVRTAIPRPDQPAVARAGLGPQSARAPPR